MSRYNGLSVRSFGKRREKGTIERGKDGLAALSEKKSKLPEKVVSGKGNESKKWTKKKIIAASVIGAAALGTLIFVVLILVFQLGPIRPIKSNADEARAVGECAGFEVRYEELRYITLICRTELDEKYSVGYDKLDSTLKAQYEAELQAMVEEKIKSNYVILSLCNKYDIDMTSKDADEYVNEQIQSLVKNELDGSTASYKEWLAKNNLTDTFVRLMYKVNYLENRLLEKFVTDKIGVEYDVSNKAEFVDYVMESGDYVKAIHAFYPYTHPDPDNTAYNARSRAVAALEKIQAADGDEARFSAMRSAIGSAPFVQGFSVTGSDYYFTYGQMDEKYEEIAFGLEEYGVGELLKTADGYYVIMRVPMDREEVKMRTTELLSQYQYATLKRAEDAERENISFVGNEYFNSIKLIEIN